MPECDCHKAAEALAQQKVLYWLLGINATMFLLEGVSGVIAQSTALIADSLDMLADAVVYALSLYAVGRSPLRKIRAASLSGIFQISLAGVVLVDVIRRFFLGELPQTAFMVGVGAIALVANVTCLWLIAKHRKGEVHMRASWIFSKNDVIANLSVIGAGILSAVLRSRFPDLIVGLGITALVLWGGIAILRETREERTALQQVNTPCD